MWDKLIGLDEWDALKLDELSLSDDVVSDGAQVVIEENELKEIDNEQCVS